MTTDNTVPGGDPDMPNLDLCSFEYLADALRKRGATVTPAPHGGDYDAPTHKGKAEPVESTTDDVDDREML